MDSSHIGGRFQEIDGQSHIPQARRHNRTRISLTVRPPARMVVSRARLSLNQATLAVTSFPSALMWYLAHLRSRGGRATSYGYISISIKTCM
jgi:hypothetical protein